MAVIAIGNKTASGFHVDTLTIAATSGLRARAESLEMLANNLANATSPGFKADREFYSTYFTDESLHGPGGSYPLTSPLIERNWTDYSQGPTVPTGGSLDFSLAGRGFFVVDTPQGPLYTRNGNFQLAKDGTVTTQQGMPVLGVDGKPIRFDPQREFQVDADGVFRQEGAVVGQLKIADFENTALLSKTESTYFRYADPSRVVVGGGKVEQGRLEGANYSPAEAAVRLVNVMRQFEMLQRALNVGAEMGRRTIDEVAKVRE
jgi:flagellar basal-body rod protein FlgF